MRRCVLASLAFRVGRVGRASLLVQAFPHHHPAHHQRTHIQRTREEEADQADQADRTGQADHLDEEDKADREGKVLDSLVLVLVLVRNRTNQEEELDDPVDLVFLVYPVNLIRRTLDRIGKKVVVSSD